jgi:peptidoglycan/LPS O-acetylase OafA/YrhL
MQEQSSNRVFQLSYLRAVVTLLVVAHHAALAYVSFTPPQQGFTANLSWTAFPVVDASKWRLLDLLVGWNDVFFMSLMFFVSGLFVWPGLRRQGAGKFIRRRLLRLGVPFVISAGVLAPLAYYPAYLQLSGDGHLSSYARAWMVLSVWPAGPAWFLWVLLVFGCVAAVIFMLMPNSFEALARWLRAVSNRPVLFFLVLAAASFAAYVPMASHFDGQMWWSWGPFFVQSSRAVHYFVYFAMGAGLGAFGTEIPIFERMGRLARRWWLWDVGMAAAFLALSELVLTGRYTAARMLFPVACAAASLFLIGIVIRYARPWRWADSLSSNAYGIYLLHYVFVIWIQYAVLHWPTPAVVKFAVVMVGATGLSWATSALLRRSKIVARVV